MPSDLYLSCGPSDLAPTAKSCECGASLKALLFADALRLLASFLLSSDRAVLQLLHVLDWRPVLQQLSPLAAQLPSTQTYPSSGDQSSLLDNDMTMSQVDATAGSAASQRNSSSRSAQGLDAGAKAWATQLLLLVLPAYVIMTDADMPEWITRLITGDHDHSAAVGVTLCQVLQRRIILLA